MTNKVRELLCRHCNLLLGYAADNITILQEAIVYLRKHLDSDRRQAVKVEKVEDVFAHMIPPDSTLTNGD